MAQNSNNNNNAGNRSLKNADSRVIILGISGGSGSGKTTLAQRLAKSIGQDKSLVLFQDSYYLDQSQRFKGDGGDVNFDHPASIEFELLAQHLDSLRKSQSVEIPIYDFSTHKRQSVTHSVQPKKIILVDGTLILSQECVRKQCDITIFIQTPEEVRFARRFKRDTAERGRTPEGIYLQFKNHVQPMHEQFVEPSQKGSNYIVTNDMEYENCFEELMNLVQK